MRVPEIASLPWKIYQKAERPVTFGTVLYLCTVKFEANFVLIVTSKVAVKVMALIN